MNRLSLTGATAVLLLATVGCQTKKPEPKTVAVTPVTTIDSTKVKGFSSTMTLLSTSECQDLGAAGKKCKGQGEFSIVRAASATTVENQAGTVKVQLAAKASHSSADLSDQMEWRLSDGVPFAVISRVKCFKDATRQTASGEYVLLRGLGKYESISEDYDAVQVTNALEIARQVADARFKEVNEGKPTVVAAPPANADTAAPTITKTRTSESSSGGKRRPTRQR